MARAGKWKRAPDIGTRIAELRGFLGETQEVFGARWGIGSDQVSEWELRKSSPPRARIEYAAKMNGWPLEVFQAEGPRPAEALRSPLTDPGLSAPQVAEMLANYRAPAPLTADADAVKRAIAVLEMVLRELKGSLSGGPRASDDLLQFVATAEAGHPTQPPPAKRQGKSG